MKLNFFLLLSILFSTVVPIRAQNGAGKIALEGNRLFIVVPNYGFSIYDVSVPTSPKEIRFVECPGVIDIAVRDEFIFASRYQDLDLIRVPKDPKVADEVVSTQFNVFPSRRVDNPNRTDVSFFKNFEKFRQEIGALDPWAGAAPTVSANGSMSALALAGDYIYAVDGDKLRTYYAKPMLENTLENTYSLEFTGVVLETVWTSGDDRLYIGSQSGVEVVDISNRARPQSLDRYAHALNCDPVVVSGNYIFSTIRSGNNCPNREGGTLNELQVFNRTIPGSQASPVRIRLTNPHGLAIQGNALLVCDGAAGLRVFDVTNPLAPKEVAHTTGLETYDVLFHGKSKMAYVSVPRQIYIFSLQQMATPQRQSIITLPGIKKM